MGASSMNSPKDQDQMRDLLRLHDELCDLRDLWVAMAQELRDDQFETDNQKRADSKTQTDALISKVMLLSKS
jgi:hypothetical protein